MSKVFIIGIVVVVLVIIGFIAWRLWKVKQMELQAQMAPMTQNNPALTPPGAIGLVQKPNPTPVQNAVNKTATLGTPA